MRKLINLALELTRELYSLKEFIYRNSRRYSERLAEEWIDSQQAMGVLKIKKRALQNLRDRGFLPFSTIHGKLYYKVSDVKQLLKSNYITRNNKDHGTE